MRRYLSRALPGACLLVAVCSAQATPVTAPVLDIYGASLTAHPPDAMTFNGLINMAPRLDQRGVDIDGTLRVPAPMGWAVAADPIGAGYSSGRALGDVNLATGSYSPTEIDLALPTLGLPVVIGRTYNNLQQDGSGTRTDYDGPQGWNWAQTAQPQIALVAGVTNDLDVLYISYGNDRFIEFKRIALNATEFKAKNGAAGVVKYTAAGGGVPDLYTYYDQRGNQITFFGLDGSAGNGAGQLWKMIDPAGNTAYVHSLTASTAASGFSAGLVFSIFDASGHKYVFTYTTVGGAFKLQRVEAQINSGGWTTVAKVEYGYYTSTDHEKGRTGDLKLVTITHKGVGGGDYVRRKYYRYYTRAYDNSDGRRGETHSIKMVVGFEGARTYDMIDSVIDQDYYSETDANLMPYAESYFEYPSGDYRLANATFNGNCGCAGGTSGTYTFSYADGSNYATDIADTSYDTAWGRRTVIAQPDGTYVSQYFDETGAPLSRVLTNTDPSGSPTKTWVTGVERDGKGLVTTICSPANVTGYTHSTGAITCSTSVGLVTTYTRHAASDNLDGLRESVAVHEGTSGTPATTSSVTFSERQLLVGASAISIPDVTASATYPSGSALTTSYSTTFWEPSTDTDVLYIAPKAITITNPIVSASSPNHNGSGSATYSYRYLRTDGTTAMTKDAGGILSYSGRTAYGQMAVQIADVNTATTGDFVAEDLSGGTNLWSVSTSGTAIHAKTSMTYDDQGRPLTVTQPGVNGDRTSARVYLLDGDRMGVLSFPRRVISGGPTTTYYGPASYTRVNHAGKGDLQTTIKVSLSGVTSLPSLTPSSSDWTGYSTTTYDLSGMRATQVDTFTGYSGSWSADTTTMDYDAMGRRARSVDATGTITRSFFDERGMTIERWVGTDDAGWTNPAGSGSSNNMVKVEELEYDGGSAGGNGYMTKRSQDSTGAWSGGVGDRVTEITYDYRGRAVVQANPVAPHSVTLYDNSNRAVATAHYSSTSGLTVSTDPTDSSASTRVALSETAYDERGQVYQSTRWEINTSNGNKGSAQITDNWYDDRGRHVKTHGAQITKTAYDRLGRVTDRYTLAFTNDGATYANALGITTGDLILEQSHSVLDATTGRALAQWTIQRTHDNGTGGTNTSLDSNADSAPDTLTFANLAGNSRWQTTAMWYDDLDRVTDTVAYGTSASAGSSTQFIRAALSCPSSTATTLKTSYAYDTAGRTSTVTDPAGIVSLTEYDFAGRRERTTDNYVSGHAIGAGANADENRVTEYTYGPGGLMSQVARRMPSSGDDQETDYEYDTVTGQSASSIIKCKNILTRVIYPEQVGSQPDTDRDVVYIYNALSQVKETIDPAGNVIETRYDAGGRVYQREATTIQSDFDARITQINTEYNSRGMVSRVYQGDGSTLDDVALGYDGWGNLISSTQDPDSAIGAATGRDEYATTWTYALTSTTGYCRAMTLSSWAQPATGTNTVTYSGMDARIGRPTALVDAASTPLSMYWYMGTSTVVGMELAEPKSGTGTYLYGTSGSSSTYSTYMDPFNRAISNKWTAGPYATSTPAYIDLGMDYDLRGNVTAVTDAVLKDSGTVTPKFAFGELMLIDNLRRLLVREEGELNGGHTAISTRARIENYQRNMAGRITSDQISLNNDSDYTDGPPAATDAGEMDDTRTYNKRNELLTRSYNDWAAPSTPKNVTLVYDLNGNLTDDGEKYKYAYNPWGQLVQVQDQTKAPVAIYTYNGLGQRISEQTDTNDSGNTGTPDTYVNSHDPVFFIAVDPQGRRIATFRSTDTYPKETFFYHPSGIRGPAGGFPGGVLVRDRDDDLRTTPSLLASAAAASIRAERMYYCSDFRGNVVALLTSGGKVAEQYRYSASGVPFGLPQGNVKSDGAVDAATTGTTDWTITDYIRVNTYEARADFDLDGDVDSADLAIVTANDGKVTGRGRLSGETSRNRLSFGGTEVFNDISEILLLSPWTASHVAIETNLERRTWFDGTPNIDADTKARSTGSTSSIFATQPGLRGCSGPCSSESSSCTVEDLDVRTEGSCGGRVMLVDFSEIWKQITRSCSPRSVISIEDPCPMRGFNSGEIGCTCIGRSNLEVGIGSPRSFDFDSTVYPGCKLKVTYKRRVDTFSVNGTCNGAILAPSPGLPPPQELPEIIETPPEPPTPGPVAMKFR